ncbi:MAG: ABC transporter substrate-binding protein, partial [Candidatus Hodarchaeota archaeon]
MKKKLLSYLVIFGVAVSLVCVGNADFASARTPKGEFRIAVTTLMGELLGPVSGTIAFKWFHTLLYDSLVGIEPPSTDLSHKTGIAYRWEHSPDYKHWTFYLRKGIKFHNGDEVTAEDVKYTLDRAVGPLGLTPNKVNIQKMIDYVEVADKYKVIIHTKQPDSLVPLMISEQIGTESMVVPKKYIEEKSDEYFRAHPIGTGPYKFKEHKPGAYMLFEAVDEHWALGVPKYKYVRISIVPETLARLGLLERGEADLIEVPRDWVREVKKRGLPIVEDPLEGTTILFFHEIWNKDYPISDIRVRNALCLGLDKQTILDTLFDGIGELAPYGYQTKASIGYEPADPAYPYDPEKAKALLKAAGYGPENPCRIPVYSFPMSAFPEAEKVIEAAKTYWDKVGFDIQIIKEPDYGVWRKRWTSHKTKGGISPNQVGGRIWSIPANNNLLCRPGGSITCRAAAKDFPELEEAFQKALTEIDPEKRPALAHR